MPVDAWALTDVGRVRDHNEDGWLIDERLGLFAVADGMGGHAAGEVASAHALRVVREHMAAGLEVLEAFAADPTPDHQTSVVRELEAAVHRASQEIFEMALRDEHQHGMGTTLSVLLIVEGKAFMAHVGDSRVYLERGNTVHQMSEDHSYLWEQLKRGLITAEEAKASPFSNVITRAVGITETVQVDTLVMDILPGDTWLICSDGLHGYIDDDEELRQILKKDDGEAATRELIDLANARGGRDNVTAVVLKVPGDLADPVALEVIEKLEALHEIPLFRHLNYKELVKVLNQTRLLTFDADEIIIRESEPGDEFYIILTGEVEVTKGEQIITRLGDKVHFGEMALVDRSPRSATVLATQPTRALTLARRAFFNLVKTEPVLSSKLLWSFVQVLSHRLRATNEALAATRNDTLPLIAVDLHPTGELGIAPTSVDPPLEGEE